MLTYAPLVTAPWQIEGDTGEALGTSVANAGDIDNDGYDDVIVGAPSHGALAANEGRVVLWRGGQDGLGASWTARGAQVDAHFGSVVAGVGDVDGDGFADVAIGAPDYDALAPDDGGVWVYFGGRDGFARTPWFNQGGARGARFGTHIAAGDIDGDGYTEIVVSERGRVLIFAGGPSGPVVTPRVVAVDAAAIVFVGDVDGDGFADFLIGDGDGFGLWRGRPDGRLEEGVERFAGARAQRLGDIDSDGFGDFVVGGTGVVALHFGSASGVMVAGPEVHGDGLGRALAAADVDGDGIVDVVASSDAGAASEIRVYAGRGARAVSSLRSTACPDCASDIGFGSAIAAGDFNGDGRGDVAVASPGFGGGRGRVAVQLGRAALLGETPDLDVELGAEGDGKIAFVGDCAAVGFEMFVACSAGALDGAGDYWHWIGEAGGIKPSPYGVLARGQRGYGRAFAGRGDLDHDGYGDVMVGQGEGPEYTVMLHSLGFSPRDSIVLAGLPGDELGASVALDGDVDGDGIVDILVGAPRAGTSLDLAAPGEVQLTFPRLVVDGTQSRRELVVPATPDWRASGVSSNGDFGRIATFAGDLDGDGGAEIVVGLPLANRIALYRSGPTPSPVLDAPRGSGRFGAAVVAGDIDGDGLGDLVVGAPGEGAERGRVHLFYGDRAAVVTPGVVLVGEPGSRFGAALATGDIDGDGFADVVVGAPGEARVHVFRGGADGVETDAAVVDGPEAEFGREVAGGGDIDSDGYGDIGVVSRSRAYVFRGNGGVSRRSFVPRVWNTGRLRRILPWSASEGPSSFAVTLRPAWLEAGVGSRLEVEVKRHDLVFDGVGAVVGPWQETLDTMRVAVAGLSANTAYHWRGRVAFRASDVPLQGRLPWVWGGTNGQAHAVHVRTRRNVAPEVHDDAHVCTRDEVCSGAGLLTNDRDGDDDRLVTIATTLTTAAGGAVVVGDHGDFSYTPPSGWIGVDTFAYEASDGVGGRTFGTVTVSVVEPGCRDTVGACLAGQWTGMLSVAGQRLGFRCEVVDSDGARSLRCDTDARGDLRLDAVVCE